jgi:hypothetical protein
MLTYDYIYCITMYVGKGINELCDPKHHAPKKGCSQKAVISKEI